jgi:hypothetical protein
MSRIVPLSLVAATVSFPLPAQNTTPIDEKQCWEQSGPPTSTMMVS